MASSISDMFNTTATFRRPTETTNEIGAVVSSYTTLAAAVPCRLRTIDIAFRRLDDSGRFIATHRVWFEQALELENGDEVVVGNFSYQIASVKPARGVGYDAEFTIIEVLAIDDGSLPGAS